MPVFFFHFRNGAEYVEDEVGLDLADDREALSRGAANLRYVLAEDALSGVLNTGSTIEITDESRGHLATVRFDDALRLEPAQRRPDGPYSPSGTDIPVNDD